eukprot:4661210-Prymnesium_polylepis.1
MKRPGLNERQAVLLRGKRELVITAESIDDLKEWNRAVQEAAKITQRNLNEVQRSADAELSKLRSHWDSMLVELEVTRSKLREEREARARMQLEADSAQIDNAQLAQQEKALLHAQLELQNREEQMRTQLESEKRKVRPRRVPRARTAAQEGGGAGGRARKGGRLRPRAAGEVRSARPWAEACVCAACLSCRRSASWPRRSACARRRASRSRMRSKWWAARPKPKPETF